MAESTQKLFKRWRAGDQQAGARMAQRFSDWYYAVAASRLGDRDGRGPLDRACRRFSQGITSLSDVDELVDWAHEIIVEELASAGGRLAGGDQPNALTRNQSPTALLQKARERLEDKQVRLLVHAYDASYPLDDLKREAESAGGYPLAVLEARYALKRVLRDELEVKLSEVPDGRPRLDLAPMPLYEAGRMTSVAEETAFEKWMLTEMELCKDLAEFAAFALALRGGALAGSPTAPPPATTTGGDVSLDIPEDKGGSKLPLVAGIVVLVVLAALAAVFLMGG